MVYSSSNYYHMYHPLSTQYSEASNKILVQKALEGEKQALTTLIQEHQPFIYNVAWKMCHDSNDARDLTQEVLIKVLTKLGQFNFKSAFRSWLYRIVVNEFLQSKRRPAEALFSSFDDYGAQLDTIPNPELTIEEEMEQAELTQEMRYRCMSGMLMCLNREQRLIYILGDTFAIDQQLGAAIFNISRENFRIKLHRARKELYNYMTAKCGLVNKNNPCRCPKKAKFLKQQGLLNEREMTFNQQYKSKIADFVNEHHEAARTEIEDKYTRLFQEHPAKDDFDQETIVEEIINDENLMRFFN